MRKAILVCGLGMLCLLLAMWGCERHTTGTGGVGGGQVANIEITAGDNVLATPAGVVDSTEITITVTDAGGNGVSGKEVELWMETNVGVLRSLSADDTTDYSGQVTTVFRVNTHFGTNVIHARVDAVTDEMEITVLQVNIAQVTVQVTPTVLNVAPGASGLCSLYVWVRDQQGNGVANVKPSLQSSIGIIENYGRTGASGQIRTNFYSAGDFGVAEIVGRVGSISDTVTVTVHPTAALTGSIQLSSDVSFIYADNGVTRANITALLKDADYQVIRDAEVIFSSPIGTVMSPVTTDSLGFARTTFTDNNIATEPDSAIIVGRYATYGISDTIKIMIHEQLPIDHITLDVTPISLTAGVDSASVRATAFLTNGDFAPAGTGVLFQSIGGGTFSSESANLDNLGQALVNYFAPNTTGYPTIRATIGTDTSNSVTVNIVPGPVRHVGVTVTPNQLLTNSNETAVVTVDVTDSLGNHVGDGLFVAMQTTLGVVTPSAITTGGVAYGTLSPGNTAGAAVVKATVGLIADSTSVLFISGGPNSITLQSDVNTIQVAQTGGNEQALLTATVNDALGNPVEDGTPVWFRIEDNGAPGGGININNHGIQDSSFTLNGSAIATLNAGVNSGPVLIKAWTYADSLQQVEIHALKSNINVASGPPATIIVSHNNVGEDIGSGNWLLDVSAMVMDVYDNPVIDGWAVSFTVLPDTALIGAENVYTGNEPYGGGDPVPGVAFSWLTYPGVATFEEVTITATCRPGGELVVGTETFDLPLQDCTVTLYIQPAAWHYDELGDPAVFECRALVREGHGLPVNNALCLFFATKGRFYTAPPPGGQLSDEKYTGIPPDPPGQATLYLVAYREFVFPDPITPEVTGTVNCSVYGYSECFTDGQQVIFQRNSGED